LKHESSSYVRQLVKKITKYKKYWNIPAAPYFGQPTFLGTGDMYAKKTYIGGIGQEMKPLLEAEELTGNRNGLSSQDITRIASG
jgi:hypothetical protein